MRSAGAVGEQARRLATDRLQRPEQRARIEVALQRLAAAAATARLGAARLASRPTAPRPAGCRAIRAGASRRGSRGSAARRPAGRRGCARATGAPSRPSAERSSRPPQVSKSWMRLGSRLDLAAQVVDGGVGDAIEQASQAGGIGVAPGQQVRKRGRRAALDQVGRERPGAAGEADDRHPVARARAAPVGWWRRRSPASRSTSGRRRRAASSTLRTGDGKRGPSPASKRSSAPIASSISRMSANTMAASTPRMSTGCTVTSAASSGVLQSSRKVVRSRMRRYSGR